MPQAEPLVGGWRSRHDAAGRTGVPAHVTLLYPFLPPDRVGRGDVERLGALFATTAVASFDLVEVRRFPGILYLAPEPSGPIRELTVRIWELYPDNPPYGGAHPQIVPHLTVAQDENPATLDEVERAVTPGLPISVVVPEAWLMWQGADERWEVGHRFPLRG